MSKKQDRARKLIRTLEALESLGFDDGECVKFNKRYIKVIKQNIIDVLAIDGIVGIATDSKVEVSSSSDQVSPK